MLVTQKLAIWSEKSGWRWTTSQLAPVLTGDLMTLLGAFHRYDRDLLQTTPRF
jgi:hypothetical protein